ncbi:hypothetical protein CA598_16845 [Paenibacillus sp. VTT E-133291]|nr:hypothetical protein CA598_16845 [Paenibacillus sp. VTT E-133291]
MLVRRNIFRTAFILIQILIHVSLCIRIWEEMNTMVRYYDKSLGLSFPIMDSSKTILLKKAGHM